MLLKIEDINDLNLLKDITESFEFELRNERNHTEEDKRSIRLVFPEAYRGEGIRKWLNSPLTDRPSSLDGFLIKLSEEKPDDFKRLITVSYHRTLHRLAAQQSIENTSTVDPETQTGQHEATSPFLNTKYLQAFGAVIVAVTSLVALFFGSR